MKKVLLEINLSAFLFSHSVSDLILALNHGSLRTV